MLANIKLGRDSVDLKMVFSYKTQTRFAAFAALLVLSPLQATAAEQIAVNYDVLFGGARIMKASYSATLGDGAYAATLDAKTVGVSKLLSKIKLSLSANGSLQKANLTPQSYNYFRKKNEKSKERNLKFATNGDLMTEGTDYDATILKAVNASVMDPLSMLLKLTRAKSPCSGKHRAFDGRDVFDITLSNGGKSGETLTCKIVYTPVAGGEVEDGDTEPKRYEITLAPIGNAQGYVPVRIAGSTKGVGFDVNATAVTVNGAPLAY
jgi:Protein of unknown function (DUF3108)